MKIVKMIFLVLLVVIVSTIIGVVVLIKTFDLNKYLPEITKVASESLKRDVRIERADATLSFNGIAVDVKGITVAETGKAPLLSIATLRFVPDMDALLSKHQLRGNIFLASGTIFADAGAVDDVKVGKINLHADIKDVKIEELLAANAIPVDLKGRIVGKIDLVIVGADIKGKGEISVVDGVIEKLNILKTVLSPVLGVVPGLAETMDSLLTDALKTKLGGDNTIIEKAQARFSIEDATVFLDEGLVSTAALDLVAKGTIGFDMKTDIQLTVRLVQDISAELSAKVEQLGYLYDENKRIKIDGKLTGVIPDLKFKPAVEFKEIAKNAIVQEGMSQLDKAIEKNPELAPAKELLNNVLGNIFK